MADEISVAPTFRGPEEPEHCGLQADWVHPANMVISYWEDGERIDAQEIYALPDEYSDITRETVQNICRNLCNAWNSGVSIDALEQMVQNLGKLVRKPNVKPVAQAPGVTNFGYIVVQPEIVQHVAVSNTGEILVTRPGVSAEFVPPEEFEQYVEAIRGYSVRV